MKLKKILAGIDLGPDTEKILAYGALFAGKLSASLTFLYVMDYLITPPEYLAAYIEDEKKIAEGQLKTWEQKLDVTELKPEVKFVSGRLHEVFLSVVEKLDIDMLVLGFRHHALRRSSSEKLIKGLQMPMLVVRGEKVAAARIGSVKIKKILCPVDMSNASLKAVIAAKALQNIFQADLEIIHVVPLHLLEDKMKTLPDKDHAREVLIGQSKISLANFLGGNDIKDSAAIYEGMPGEKIVSVASENDHDLIVIGARGLSYIKKMLIGSVTDAVLKSSPCPVYVIH